jgi:hypothetical protein
MMAGSDEVGKVVGLSIDFGGIGESFCGQNHRLIGVDVSGLLSPDEINLHLWLNPPPVKKSCC